ncbi:MAG: glycine--tRNA ligase [Deltaproteobacteria bacterium]|nr:glycine--tRNA ligase [Deltaproteobacteria bacterium]
MEKIVSLCKRRGFIYPSSEIYGGLNSCYDYGPLGSELKRSVKDFWWKSMTQTHTDIHGLDSAILMAPRIWEASGHLENFTDPLVDCKNCKSRFRQDHLNGATACPKCQGELTEARQFNLMFKTFMGPLEDAANTVYLRPETAQGIYVNYQNVMTTARAKLPFGIAQIGKAFRNEITPGNFTFRTREFEQMEMQYFVKPGEDDASMDRWKEIRRNWYDKLMINSEKLRFHEHQGNELAHYAKAAYDIEYEFPFGWSELEGVHNRTDFDLSRHQEYSGKNLQYFEESTKEKFIPYIIETSAGCDRSILCILCDAYSEEEERVVLRFAPFIAPVQVAILPLVKKDGLPDIMDNIANKLKKHYRVAKDVSGSIGKRYRRQDEIGTPFCITIDYESKDDNTVTIRHRDSMQQERISIDAIESYIEPALALPID